MTKLVLDSESMLIQVEMSPNPDAPPMAISQPTIHTGELTEESALEQLKWFMEQIEYNTYQQEEDKEKESEAA